MINMIAIIWTLACNICASRYDLTIRKFKYIINVRDEHNKLDYVDMPVLVADISLVSVKSNFCGAYAAELLPERDSISPHWLQ